MKRTLSLSLATLAATTVAIISVAPVAQAKVRPGMRPIPIDQALLGLHSNFKLGPIGKLAGVLARDIECEAGLIDCAVPMAKPAPVVKVSVTVTVPTVAVTVPPVAVPPAAVVVPPPVTIPPVVVPIAVPLAVVPFMTVPTASTSTCTVVATGAGVAECTQSASASAQS